MRKSAAWRRASDRPGTGPFARSSPTINSRTVRTITRCPRIHLRARFITGKIAPNVCNRKVVDPGVYAVIDPAWLRFRCFPRLSLTAIIISRKAAIRLRPGCQFTNTTWSTGTAMAFPGSAKGSRRWERVAPATHTLRLQVTRMRSWSYALPALPNSTPAIILLGFPWAKARGPSYFCIHSE